MEKAHMPRRLLIMLIAAVLVAMGTILAVNVTSHQKKADSERYIRLNDIRGLAVVHKGLEYPLNFKQQTEVALSLNRSVQADGPLPQMEAPSFDKIVIYTFKNTTIELFPIGFKDGRFIYSAPLWDKAALTTETNNGLLKEVLLNSYDA